MDTTKKFVYAKGAGIVFCPDDVLYVKENNETKWNNDKGEFFKWSSLYFINGKTIEFEQIHFEEVQNLLLNSINIKKEYDTSKEQHF